MAHLTFEELCDKFTYFYDFAPVGYFISDNKNHIPQDNQAGTYMVGTGKSRYSESLSESLGKF